MFILGMVAMYFLLNLILVVSLLIKERHLLRDKQRWFRVVRKILFFLLTGVVCCIWEIFND